MPEAPLSEPPMMFFSPTIGGYRADLDDSRNVQLALGESPSGAMQWRLQTENCGHVISLCLSDEAMDAILRMYCSLLVDAMAEGTEEPAA